MVVQLEFAQVFRHLQGLVNCLLRPGDTPAHTYLRTRPILHCTCYVVPRVIVLIYCDYKTVIVYCGPIGTTLSDAIAYQVFIVVGWFTLGCFNQVVSQPMLLLLVY
jgi:hypothetical protein